MTYSRASYLDCDTGPHPVTWSRATSSQGAMVRGRPTWSLPGSGATMRRAVQEASWGAAAADSAQKRVTSRSDTAAGDGAAGGAGTGAAEGGSHWWRKVGSRAHGQRSAAVPGRGLGRWVW